MSVALMVLGLVLFIGLVIIHEYGHFIMARRNGVEVEEFGIFFPPRLKGWKTKHGWIFSINWLPIGGFVKLKGEHDVDTEPGSMGAASVWGKTQIMAAGVVMNLIAAYVLLVLLALVGMPHIVDNQFIIKHDAAYVEHARMYVIAGTIERGSPADKAGIKEGDIIVAAGAAGHLMSLANANQLPSITQQYAGKALTVQYRQDDTSPVQEKTVQLRSAAEVDHLKASGKDAGYLGVGVDESRSGVDIVRSTWSAPVVAVGTMWQFTALTFQALGKALAGIAGIVAGFATHNTVARQAAQTEASSQVAGPVGIFFVFKYGSALGIRFILLIVAILSLTLGIMNILPIPALDGGRLWLMLFTRAIHRPLSPEREEAINAAGFAFLMGLIILITVVDVRRFF